VTVAERAVPSSLRSPRGWFGRPRCSPPGPGASRAASRTWFAARAKEPQAPDRLDELTDRELEALALVAEGLSNVEIAERLVVSPATAKTHVSRTMGKLGGRDRAQLVVIAYESGLVCPGWLG
jgi:DNA-binding NarL/FixJ family response regulator